MQFISQTLQNTDAVVEYLSAEYLKAPTPSDPLPSSHSMDVEVPSRDEYLSIAHTNTRSPSKILLDQSIDRQGSCFMFRILPFL